MYSNCFMTALLYKIKHPIKTKVYFVIPKEKDGIPHVIWNDGIYKHFTYKTAIDRHNRKWYHFLLFKGVVKEFPDKFIQNVKLKRIL